MSKLRYVFALLVLVPLSAAGFPRRPTIIAVAGGSASGKTFLARKIVAALGAHRAHLMSADDYYDPANQDPKFYRDGGINYDHPSAVNLQKLAWHLSYLRSGFSVEVPEYTYGRPAAPRMIHHHPKEFIVVEGIFNLFPDIANLADYRVFVHADPDVRLQRRLHRDQVERSLKPEDILEYFDRVVEPMHQRFVQPSALMADYLIRSRDDGDEAVTKIVAAVEQQALEMREIKGAVMLETYRHAMHEVRDARPGEFAILPIEMLHPSQEDLGFLALSYKSELIDNLVRESALRPERASVLRAYLENNPIPIANVDGRPVIADHHHLLAALHAKGIREVLTTIVEPSTVDPARLAWVRAQRDFVHVGDLKNNPNRSLATLVRDLGYVKKTGKHHEEFEWAEYYRDRLKNEHQIEVTEAMLLDVEQRGRVLKLAVAFAKDARAKDLPGYVGPGCEERLGIVL